MTASFFEYTDFEKYALQRIKDYGTAFFACGSNPDLMQHPKPNCPSPPPVTMLLPKQVPRNKKCFVIL